MRKIVSARGYKLRGMMHCERLTEAVLHGGRVVGCVPGLVVAAG